MKYTGCIFLALALFACSKSKNISNSNPDPNKGFGSGFKIETGWDIYTGGVYRYGPSIIQNADGSIDAWFAAPGDFFGDKTLLHNDEGAQSPIALNGNATAAQKFTASTSFFAAAIPCPNWGTTNSSLTLSLYQWQTNYATTIASAPLKKVDYINFSDNQNLQVANDDKFPAGDYLWVLSNPAGNAGVWKKEGAINNVINFADGVETGGSYQAFLLLNPSSGAHYWDQASYMHSSDAGKTWSEDKMVLKPTEGTRDGFSICDPGLVKIGNYYYAGYTSTEDARGLFNHAYVARSLSPEGPWQKWSGDHWGDDPQPIIEFNGDVDAWGAGEPSMVVNNDTLFFYYTWTDKDINETRVAIASASDANWPAQLTLKGTAVNKTAITGSDHCDVKYRPDLKKYYALHTASRLTSNSYIVLWESTDGLTFKKLSEYRAGLKSYLHNCGWSGDEKGHIDPAKPQFISYAYGPNWANWATAWHPITFNK